MNPTGPKTEPPRDLTTPTPSAADLRCPIGFAELPESHADRPAGVSRTSHPSQQTFTDRAVMSDLRQEADNLTPFERPQRRGRPPAQHDQLGRSMRGDFGRGN